MAGLLRRRSVHKDNKLYVLVRTDLPHENPVHKTVQSGHSVAGYVADNDNWNPHGGSMVYLGVDSEYELKLIKHKLDRMGIANYMFYEPYWDEYTSLSMAYHKSLFNDLNLLKF